MLQGAWKQTRSGRQKRRQSLIKIAIASGKGGTGKTTLSTNFADYMSAKGWNIVLADLDVEEPNSGLFIKGQKKDGRTMMKHIPEWNSSACSGCGRCDGLCNFNALLKLGKSVMILPELCHSCYACSELCPDGALPMKAVRMGELTLMEADGFDFLESRLDIGQEQAVPLIADSIDYINDRWDDDKGRYLVIMDSPPGTSCPVIETTKNADFVILVTEPTPFGLHDLSLAVETMREIGQEFAVIVNRYGIGNDDVETYCRDNNIRILARFPNMRKAAEIYSTGGMINREIPEFRFELEKIEDFIDEKFGSRI